MNKLFKLFLSGLIFLSGLFACSNVAAVVNCKASTSYPALNNTVALAGTFYAGSELPVGSVIYRTTVSSPRVSGIYCDAAFTVPRYYSVATEPVGKSFGFGNSPYNGEIYPTNVEGIGVAVWYSSKTFTKNSPLERADKPYTLTTGGGHYGISSMFDLSLIKTGPIDTGSVVNGVSLPTVIMYAGAKEGYSGLPITTWTVNFSGAISFISQTCQTPDVNVSMGSYEVNEYFRKVGSTTPWIDSSIKLENCPTFTGYHDNKNPQAITGSGTPSGVSIASNILKISLQPLSNFIDNGNGVFAVSSSGGGREATGIGLQLGYTPDINASPTTPTTIWKSGDTWSVTPPSNGTANFRIPLAARYYQTSQVVTPGPADGKVVFTINYQ